MAGTTKEFKKFYKFRDIKPELREAFKEYTQTKDKRTLMATALEVGYSAVVRDFKTFLNTDTLTPELLEEIRSLFDLHHTGNKVFSNINERMVLNIITFIVDITARIKLRSGVKPKEQRHTALAIKHKVAVYNRFIFLISNQHKYLFDILVLRAHRHLITYSAYKNRVFYKSLKVRYSEHRQHLNKLDKYFLIESIAPAIEPAALVMDKVGKELDDYKQTFTGDLVLSAKARGKRGGLISTTDSQAYQYLVKLILTENNLKIKTEYLLSTLNENFYKSMSMTTINDLLNSIEENELSKKVDGFIFTDKAKFEVICYILDAVEIITNISIEIEDDQKMLFEEFKALKKRIETFTEFKHIYIFKQNLDLTISQFYTKCEELKQSLLVNEDKKLESVFKTTFNKFQKEYL